MSNGQSLLPNQQVTLFTFPYDTNSWKINENITTFDRKPPPQLLKWIGNKQRFAPFIANVFPKTYNRYFEPFLGSGAVLGAMAPHSGVASDILKPLIDMWVLLQEDPEQLYQDYKKCLERYIENPKEVYKEILANFNEKQNPLDFAFLSRSCYGGVVRFTKQGKMSTPVGPHKPISPDSFRNRMMLWRERVKNTKFICAPYQEIMEIAADGDIIYCDPPYVDSQAILYGAQAFRLKELWEEIIKCKSRGVKIALSIDGHKKSGSKVIELGIPVGLFERQLLIAGGSSMLKRFQKRDEIMIGEDVHDRLLLTW